MASVNVAVMLPYLAAGRLSASVSNKITYIELHTPTLAAWKHHFSM